MTMRAWLAELQSWRARLSARAGRLGVDGHVLAAAGVALGTLVLLAATSTQGFVRDEGYYFRAAREYHGWFEELWRNLWEGRALDSFSDASVRRHFGYNTEHPGFVKLLMGWTWKVFHVWLGWTGHATGYRLASMSLVAVGNAFLYLWGARLFDRRVGLLAVALFLASPHVFYHAHLAAFDGPIVGLTVASAYAFWRSLSARAWIVPAGLLWGLALATKHNAVFLVATFGLAVLLGRWRELGFSRGGGLRLPALPLAFLAMLVLGPLVLYVFYPYGWPDPLARLAAYYRFHLNHEHYPVDYFGTLYFEPPFPWSFPFVMSLVTVPLPVLVTGLAGVVLALRAAWRATDERERIGWWLLLLCVAVPPAIIAVPSVPIFGGTKHWMPMMPFFCLLGAWAIREGAAGVRAALPRTGVWLAPLIVALVVLMPALETARTHPLGHTYFNELALGHQGGAALGMPRTFWGGDARELLDVVNTRARPGARVFGHRMNFYDFQAYQADGLLRADLRWVGDLRQAEWAFINHQREYQDEEYAVWELTGDERPVAVLEYDGVPIVSVYELGRGAGR